MATKHSDDQLRRWAGFKILARPKEGPASWRRDGLIVGEETALKVARKELEEYRTKVKVTGA